MWTPVNLVYTGKAQRARGWAEGRRGGCRACNLPCTRHQNKPKSMQPWHTDSQIPATYPTPAFSAAPGVPQPTEIVIEQTPIPGLRRLLSSFLYSHLFPSLLLGDQGGVQWGHGRQLARSLRLKVSEQGWALSGTGLTAFARGRPALGGGGPGQAVAPRYNAAAPPSNRRRPPLRGASLAGSALAEPGGRLALLPGGPPRTCAGDASPPEGDGQSTEQRPWPGAPFVSSFLFSGFSLSLSLFVSRSALGHVPCSGLGGHVRRGLAWGSYRTEGKPNGARRNTQGKGHVGTHKENTRTVRRTVRTMEGRRFPS